MMKYPSYSLNNPYSKTDNAENKPTSGFTSITAPQINLPKGGGSIRSIDEKFSVNAATGTSTMSIAFPFSLSRNGFMPSLGLAYNSGGGNSIFGLGWNAEPAAIVRKTDKKFPEYNDEIDSDVFVFSGAEDLVPAYNKDASGNWTKDSHVNNGIVVTRYRPRIESGFSRIEKITEASGNVYWKVTSSSNSISVFGKSKSAQLFDPSDPTKIFKWLFEFSYDEKGNCFQYEYKNEDKVNVPNELHEKNRLNDFSTFTNVYLKRIKYGNKIHFNRGSIDLNNWSNFLNNIEYLLELVFDYGEYDIANPQSNDDRGWLCRTDPFSDYRAGFEIRTYRLCRRVLMFHLFSELGTTPCLVSSLDINYDAGTAFTFLKSVVQKGYIRKADGDYSQKSMPPAEFGYEPLGWNTEINNLPQESLDNLPGGIDDRYYRWIDLYKEGISGILTEQAGGWYYKNNRGDGNFEGTHLISSKPSLNGISAGALHFADIEARGQQFLVSDDLNGYYELSDDNEWLPFKNFATIPNLSLHDPNMKYLDLNGDGIADILISEDSVFTWYQSKGKDGFKSYKKLSKVFDEEKGPNMVFADSTESIVLADMSGDGLMDIVRIRFSEVSYWPNLGYGRFGAKVNMSNSPVFDNAENFNPRYVKLADLDGSGTTDIVYLGHNTFKIYFNQSGNSWSGENIISGVNPLPFSQVDDHSTVSIIDLLGGGTGCIVWSSPLPFNSGDQMRYIDLMGGKKPHVMNAYKNNMGKEVNIKYKPSTFYYLQDKRARTPWITKLPFVVQCVSEVEMIDQIRKSRFTNQYSYHHGYYDHFEKEFRGFGKVEQRDTEDFERFQKLSDPGGGIQLVDERFYEPPTLTKTWFHTGAFLDKEKIFTQFAHEYYSNNIIPEKELTDPSLPADLTVDEWREALRTCKGLQLRGEIYSPDGSAQQDIPYTTMHNSCLVQLLQPRLQNGSAVFHVQESESITYSYERNPADPRIAHNMTIETDVFGNVLKAAAINYGRKTADPNLTATEQAEQSKTHVVYSQSNVTNTIDDGINYHLPVGYESLTYEITGLVPQAGNYFSITEIKNGFDQAETIAYQSLPTTGKQEKRLMEHVISTFLKNDMSGPLGLGVIESLALPYQAFKLSLTPDLVNFIYGDKVSNAMLIDEGKYVNFNDNNYWIASGTQTMDANNFYQVTEVTDPFGFKVQISFDTSYRLFVQQTTDAVGNSTQVLAFNYRTLSPYLVMDTNDNLSAARTDELGMVMSSFVMGKTGENKGDFLDINSVEASALDQPGSTFEYDIFNYINNNKPAVTKTSSRDTHYFDAVQTGKPSKWRLSYTYVCGSGNAVMNKVQAEPGIAIRENDDGTFTEVDTTPNPRWIGNGRALFNNKGKTVKRYESYFSTTFEFEDAKELVERGVTAIITYDSAGRAIRTDLPDGTFAKVEFDSWMQQSFDQNDTVLESQWYKDRIITPVTEIATPAEVIAANKAAAHANTPSVSYLDSLGRNFIAIADNGAAGKYKTTKVTDLEGNKRSVTDAAGNVVMQYKNDMLGVQLYHLSMDAGERWIINDVMGRPMRSWDSRNHMFRYEYDSLHRTIKVFVKQGNDVEINTEKIIYGEGIANDKTLNLRGKSYKHYDAGGVVTNVNFDFKGNGVQGNRQLLKNYKTNADWNVMTDADLETDLFATVITYDAFNRPTQLQTPDNSIIRPVYSDAGPLNEVYVSIKGMAEKQFVKNLDYDAKGQRQSIVYGNNTSTNYRYDDNTSRLTELLTTGKNGTDLLQKLQYTYDPVGNISFIKDVAQPDIFFNNVQVKAENDYIYDAIYQLITATGREHIGQNNVNETATNNDFRNFPFENTDPSDAQAMRNYTQRYLYDTTGNIRQLQHLAGTGSYTRSYQYNNNDTDRNALGIAAGSIKNNQLLATTIGSSNTRYQYDAHGNMLNQPHLQNMLWNFKEELQQINLGGGGIAYYVYDGNGQRIRKIIERQDGSKEERIYLGGFELYRKTASNNTIQEETGTLHIMDDTRRIAIIETKTVDKGVTIISANWQPLIRYQFNNNQGSSALELDENAVILSYEEYHPYGTTSFSLVNKDIQAANKRYRYTGRERDEESGLEYHSARYYLPWLARWLSADPLGVQGGMNLYEYAKCNPVVYVDITGGEPGYTMADLKDKTEAGTSEVTEVDTNSGDFKYSKTTIGYGWVDAGNGLEKKIDYNLVETSYYNKYTEQHVKTISVSFFEVEHETRGNGKLDLTPTKRTAPPAPPKKIQKSHTEVVTKVHEREFKDVTPKAPQEDKHPIFNRVIGGLKAAAAYAEITAGAALCTGTLGVGCVLGVILIAHGLDSAVAGIRGAIDGELHRTFTSEYLLQKGLGFSRTGAEFTDLAISLSGGLLKLGQWGLKPLGKLGLKQPFTEGALEGSMLGGTDKLTGAIKILPGLDKATAEATRMHEGVHRILTLAGNKVLALTGKNPRLWLYENSSLVRWAEEGFAQSVGTGSWRAGFSWINKVGFKPKALGGLYEINPGMLLLEGGGLAVGTGVGLGLGYGGYKWADKHHLTLNGN